MSTAKLSRTVVEDLCKRYSQQNIDYSGEVISYSLKAASDTTIGFLGCHETLSVFVRKDPSDAAHELIFFMKSAPITVASRAKFIEEFGVYKKEVSAYRNVLPKLQESFTDEFSCRCYYAKDDILIFDHLGQMGFRMGIDHSAMLDFEHLDCALSSLAGLHASSIIFEARNQQTIPELFPEVVKENSYPSAPSSLRRQNFNKAVKTLCELIKVIPEFKDSDRLEYILEEFPRQMNKIFEFVQPSSKYLNVLSHGDSWPNNFLFKYENAHPVESRIVDFQLMRYAPPILDVMTLLTVPTSKDFRLKYMDSLLASYYEKLGNILKQHQFEIDDYINRQQFEDSIKEFQLFGLIESCLICYVTMLPAEVTSDPEIFQDFLVNKRSETCLAVFRNDVIYRSRLTDMISDLINKYILK